MKIDRKKHKYFDAIQIERLNSAVKYLLDNNIIKRQNELVKELDWYNGEIKLTNLLSGVYKNIPLELIIELENKYDISQDWLEGKSDCMLNSLGKELHCFNELIGKWQIVYKDTLKFTINNMEYHNKEHLLGITINSDLINLLAKVDDMRKLISGYDEEERHCCLSDLVKTSKKGEYVLIPIEKLPFLITLDSVRAKPKTKALTNKLFKTTRLRTNNRTYKQRTKKR